MLYDEIITEEFMKKVLFFISPFLLLGIGAMAQKVIYDETNQTGVRTVVCEGMNLGVSNNMDVYVALAGFQYKSTIRYCWLLLSGRGMRWKFLMTVSVS